MKYRNKIILFTAVLLYIAANSGCKKIIKVTTTINRNGSFLRTVEVIQKDSTSVPHAAFPIPQDSTWNITINRVHEDSGDFIYRAEKIFKNADELNSFFCSETDTVLKTKVEVDFEKRFRWFYTFFEYHETYKCYNQFKLVPITDYMTEQELEAYQAHEDSSELKEKFEEWFQRAIFEEFYQVLIDGAKRLKAPDFTPELIESKKEILYTQVIKAMDSDKDEMKDLIELAEKILNSSVVVKLESDLEKMEKSVTTRIEFYSAVNDDSLITVVNMPGLLVDTNAPKIEGNQVTWNIAPGRYFIRDFEATAVSRVTNKWAIGITIGICILLFGGLALTNIRSKNA